MPTSNKKIQESEVRTFLDQDKKIYLKRPKSWQRIYLWWEDSERWFLNKAYTKRTKGGFKLDESVWINTNGLDSFISFAVRQGYEIYVDNEQDTV